MKRLIPFLLLLLVNCGLLTHTVTEQVPGPTVYITKHDTVALSGPPIYVPVVTVDTLNVHDTLYQAHYIKDTSYVGLPQDSVDRFKMYIHPIAGDNYPALQAAINYCIQNACGIFPSVGQYPYSHPLIVANRQGNDYGQSFIDLEGPANAMNTPGNYLAQFIYTGTDGFGLGLQQCKGCTVKNIAFLGGYLRAGKLTQLQVDTLRRSDWLDGVHSDNRTSPYAGIAIDPFGDPSWYDEQSYKKYSTLAGYYLPGMGRPGSTDIDIQNCTFNQFIVGIVVSPSPQQNAEEIKVSNYSFENCMSGYAQCQAQSKANLLDRGQCWGQVHTIFDMANFGFPSAFGVTMPWVDNLNIAGFVYQLVAGTTINFNAQFQRIYAEGLYRLGDFYNWPPNHGGIDPLEVRGGLTFISCDLNFQTETVGVPYPDHMIACAGVTFIGCKLRLMNNDWWTQRLLLTDEGAVFRDCSLGNYPIIQRTDPTYYKRAILDNAQINGQPGGPVVDFRGTVAPWDTTRYIGSRVIHIDRNNFTGYMLLAKGDSVIPQNDYFTMQGCIKESIAHLMDLHACAWNGSIMVGMVSNLSPNKDTAYLIYMGENQHDGDTVKVFLNRLR